MTTSKPGSTHFSTVSRSDANTSLLLGVLPSSIVTRTTLTGTRSSPRIGAMRLATEKTGRVNEKMLPAPGWLSA